MSTIVKKINLPSFITCAGPWSTESYNKEPLPIEDEKPTEIHNVFVYLEALHSLSDLFVIEADLSQGDLSERITHAVTTWKGECEEAFRLKPKKENRELLKDYEYVVSSIPDHLYSFNHERVLIVYDKHAHLQGVAVVTQKKSRKKQNPFIKIDFLLSAFGNLSQIPSKKHPIRGAGSALIAKTIEILPDSKLIFLVTMKSSRSFYEALGFVPTVKNSEDGLKLLNKDFQPFMQKRAKLVGFPSHKYVKINENF